MTIIPSVCSSLVFPKSRKDFSYFSEMAKYISEKGIKSLEFYHDGDGVDKVGYVLNDLGIEGMYIAVFPLKQQQLHLCNTDDANRQEAVKLACNCMREANFNGISHIMLNSGRTSGQQKLETAALYKSINEIHEYNQKHNLSITFTLEPCDSRIDSKQLVGPTDNAVTIVKTLRADGVPIELTMDIAHIAEEGEDAVSAIKKAKDYCNHVHFANCFLADKQSPLYGDKHLLYEHAKAVYSYNSLRNIVNELNDIYETQTVKIGLEFLGPESNEFQYFDSCWNSLNFLY